MAELSTALSIKVAAALLKGAATKARTAALGDEEQRGFARACKAASRKVVEQELGGIENYEASHSVALMERLLEAGDADWLSAVPNRELDAAAMERWKNALKNSEQLEVNTLPIPFERAVHRLADVLPTELASEAARQNSALFNEVCLRYLETILSQLSATSTHSPQVLANSTLPIEARVMAQLEDEAAKCASRNKRFLTPHLLYALLTLETGKVAMCFDRVELGLAARTLDRLALYTSKVDAGPYVSFTWDTRPEIGLARFISGSLLRKNVDDVALLAAFLQGVSNTRAQLENFLGTNFVRLCNVTDMVLQNKDFETPGRVFDE